jgi:hypothetical protein
MIPTIMNSLINYANGERILAAALIKREPQTVKNSLKLSLLRAIRSGKTAPRDHQNCEVDQPRFPNQNRFPYGLQRTLYHLGFGYRPCRRRHSETVDAGTRSRRLHHYHSARYRRRLCRHLDRSSLRGRELRRWLDHVDRGRDDFAFALSTDSQAKDVSDGDVGRATCAWLEDRS